MLSRTCRISITGGPALGGTLCFMNEAPMKNEREALAARHRQQQAEFLALPPRERLAAMQRLIDDSWAVLSRNPAGLAHFLARNYRARSIHYRPRNDNQ